MNASGPVLCIGLTPALQRTLTLDTFEPGKVNRALTQTMAPGGKACNAARTLHCLGRSALILGFNGGASGRALADQLDAIGLAHRFVTIEASTRTCTTVIDRSAGQITELVEESPWPGTESLDELIRAIDLHAATASAALIAGALPPGADAGAYAAILKALAAHEVPVFVDTCGDPFLQARGQGPLLMKMNHDEQLATDNVTEKVFAARTLAAGVPWLLVTNGKHPAHLYGRDAAPVRFHPPAIREVNGIGSGDACTAGIVHAWLDGAAIPEAVRFGLACGAANATSHLPGAIDPGLATQLQARITSTGARS